MEKGPGKPSFAEEKLLQAQGYRRVAGIDEVGRGALAGPVTAAAVILPERLRGKWVKMVRDSKQLTPARREFLYEYIIEKAVAFGIGFSDCRAVEKLGIVGATRRAMHSAVKQLSPAADYLLIDYLRLPETGIPHKGITFGDSISMSIACASIIAKVTRDRMMVEMDAFHPGYGLGSNKGYGTPEHLGCLERLGPSPAHRRTFRPVCQMRLPLETK